MLFYLKLPPSSIIKTQNSGSFVVKDAWHVTGQSPEYTVRLIDT
jgi:hypothetical protein